MVLDATATYAYIGLRNTTYFTGVYKFKLSDGTSSVLAGSSADGYSDGTGSGAEFINPAGLARAGNTLYVSEPGACDIRAIDLTTQVVTRVAGSTSGICSPFTDGDGTSALFEELWSIATDGTDYLYIADTGNNVIRRMTLASPYTVTTLAGSPGNSGTVDGNGASARFDGEEGLFLNGDTLFIADYNNQTVRTMDVTTNEVTTFLGVAGSGGPNDGARLPERAPYQMTSDGTYVYWADTANHRIQQMKISDGTVSTLAGSGTAGSSNGTGVAAQFKSPHGVATDGTNLYVADTENHSIRMIVLSTGVVSTIAGKAGTSGSTNNSTGTSARFNYPSDLVYSGGYLYVTDTGNHTIRKVSTTSPYAVTLIAGAAGTSGSTNNATGTSARFLYPSGITADGTNLYVTDENQLIRQITIGGTQTVTTLAGSSGSTGSSNGTGTAASFNYPRGITSDGSGNLYVADYANNLVRKIVISSKVVTTVAGATASAIDADDGIASATLASPLGIISTASGLFVANSFNIRLIH
jgi:sugar lactone lactonase YvrE